MTIFINLNEKSILSKDYFSIYHLAGKQEYYDPGHMWCDHQERVDCGDRPICDKNDENCIEPSTTVTDPSKPTPPPFECPQPSGYFADPTNCIKYYHCYEGTVEERITCPIGKS